MPLLAAVGAQSWVLMAPGTVGAVMPILPGLSSGSAVVVLGYVP